MTIIRYGVYTVYKGIEMSITEYYGHGLNQETGENHRIISYPKEYGQLEDFIYDIESKKFKRDIIIKDLDNAFYVTTKALYQGEEFILEPYYGDNFHFHLATQDKILGTKLGFYQLHDGYGRPYYLGEIKKTEVEKIWEERKPSTYDLPIPAGLELYKELEIPNRP